MKKQAYLYSHTRLDTNEVFYIGIGIIKNYKRAYQSNKSRNIFWKNIVNKTKYEVKIIADNLNWQEACELEKKLIKQIGRKDLGLGTLVNLTDGGDGNVGMSQEIKDKISNSLKGKIQSEETRLKRSKALKETWKSEDLRQLKREQTKELNRLGLIGTKGTPSKKKGISLTQEQKDKTSKGLLEYYKTHKPANFITIDIQIENSIREEYNNGVNRFKLHKKYNLNRKIIDRILKNEN